MSWEGKYKGILNTTGVVSPSSYNELAVPVNVPGLLGATGAAGNMVSVNTNPAAELYVRGAENQLLNAAGGEQCLSGCMDGILKPDPRSSVVKPLYSASVFSAMNGSALPNPYNTSAGMYQ